jgi:hypothetical protein
MKKGDLVMMRGGRQSLGIVLKVEDDPEFVGSKCVKILWASGGMWSRWSLLDATLGVVVIS